MTSRSSGMFRGVPTHVGATPLRLLDSIATLAAQDAGSIVVSGSHGGRSAAAYAVPVPLALACFNDAGVGKERAGIVALDLLQARGTPCVTVSHLSARIGEANDTWARGVVSFVNDAATQLGIRAGHALRDEIERCFGDPAER